LNVAITPPADDAQPHYQVTITPKGWTYQTSDATSLLAAARLAGIDLPASCRNGTCRTCMCRVAEGHVRHGIEWPGLSREEKAEGYILPCVAFAESDLVIEAGAARALEGS
jgi:ferredoxin